MKKLILYNFLIIYLFSSCEDVVQIDLDQSEPRLVIEASILWYKSRAGNIQTIKISETTAFYSEASRVVENASVKVFGENEEEHNFIFQETGLYMNNTFNPVLNSTYTLVVQYEDQLFTATEKFIPVTSLDRIEQSNSGGFSGEDIEIKAFYTDPEAEENYYLFKFRNENVTLEIYEDEFTNGNQIFGYYSDDAIEIGDQIDIQLQGISRNYFEYLFILRSQIGSNDGGPFETMPATVKGNIVNQSNPDNYPLGYFRLSEVDSILYTVQ